MRQLTKDTLQLTSLSAKFNLRLGVLLQQRSIASHCLAKEHKKDAAGVGDFETRLIIPYVMRRTLTSPSAAMETADVKPQVVSTRPGVG